MLTALMSRLDDWEQRLEGHFETLAAARRLENHPVFALEHPLSEDDVAAIASDLRKWLALGEALRHHWLLWVIYSTELGYDYDGLEFWHSFERRTPHWRSDPTRRSQLRRCFHRFQTAYNGFQPSGPWAAQFSIIAWPITHALLPKDLQQQLARLLYEERYLIAEFAASSAPQVGRLLRLSAHGSARLLNLLEQEELVGLIVASLLRKGSESSQPTIAPTALARIIRDLESRRDARTWLQEARKAADAVTVRLANLRLNRLGVSRVADAAASASREAQLRSVRPGLKVSRKDAGSWQCTLELPSFAGVATLEPRYASFLRENRCTVPAAGATWYPRGWLLNGGQRRKLVEWPDPAKPVLRFESWDGAIHHILQSECRISDGPRWLFRIGSDGNGIHVQAPKVRPGHSYLLLSTSPVKADAEFSEAHIDCKGVTAVEFAVDERPSEEAVRGLASLGLAVERVLRVWPVGLPPVHWDGEGHAEWLSGDEISIAVAHSDSCEELLVQVAGQQLKLSRLEVSPTLVCLGRLADGVYTMTVSATYQGGVGGVQLRRAGARAELDIVVRPRRNWTPGVSAHDGLIVSSLPAHPSLEALLDGRVAIHIAGPEHRTVHCRVDLRDAGGDGVGQIALGDLKIPASADWLRSALNSADVVSDSSDLLLQAASATLVVDGDELGTIRYPLVHRLAPIRWVSRTAKGIEVQLLDDTDAEGLLQVTYSSFRHPTKPSEVETERGVYRQISDGGLYTARCGNEWAAIVVSPPTKIASLEQLAAWPELREPLRSGEAVVELLSAMAAWSGAKLVGPLARQRRAIALRGMEDQLIATMCWPQWLATELMLRGRDLAEQRAALENQFNRHLLSYAIAVSSAHSEIIAPSIEDGRQSLLAVSLRFQVCGDERLCEAAIRLAGSPDSFLKWSGSAALALLDGLSQNPVLVRAARLAAILAQEGVERASAGWVQ